MNAWRRFFVRLYRILADERGTATVKAIQWFGGGWQKPFQPSSGDGSTFTTSEPFAASVPLPASSMHADFVTLASPNITVAVSGVAGPGAVGTVGVRLDRALSGIVGTGAAGSVALTSAVASSGVASSAAVGTLTPNLDLALPGIAGPGAVGTVTPSGDVALTGVSGTTAVGTVSRSNTDFAATGVAAAGAVGTLTASVTPTPAPPPVPAVSSVPVFVPQDQPAVLAVVPAFPPSALAPIGTGDGAGGGGGTLPQELIRRLANPVEEVLETWAVVDRLDIGEPPVEAEAPEPDTASEAVQSEVELVVPRSEPIQWSVLPEKKLPQARPVPVVVLHVIRVLQAADIVVPMVKPWEPESVADLEGVVEDQEHDAAVALLIL